MVQGDTREVVAYALMQDVLRLQIKGTAPQPHDKAEPGATMTETELLSLYHRCLQAVQGQHSAS